MIDSLPLDLFGTGEPEDATHPDGPVSAICPWCAAHVAPDATTCPECDARLLPNEPAKPESHDGICQWCGSTIAPGIDACPTCGWDARGDNEVEIPGITTPLSESQVRSLYGDNDGSEPYTDDAIALVTEIIGVIPPRG